MAEISSLLTGRPVVTLQADATVLAAAREMTRQEVGAILVVDAHQQPCGIFTERDLMVRIVVAGRDPGAVRLADVMTRNVYTAPPERKIAEMRLELQQRHIRHLPVVRGDRVLGMLSLRDLLRADLEQASSELSETRRYILGEAGELPPA